MLRAIVLTEQGAVRISLFRLTHNPRSQRFGSSATNIGHCAMMRSCFWPAMQAAASSQWIFAEGIPVAAARMWRLFTMFFGGIS
jgi:hypothetical protein